MDQFYYFLRRILFTVIANPLCPFAFSLSFVMLYIVLFYIIQSIYSIQINIKILGDKVFHCVLREEFLHLAVELRCQCFIVGKYQSWFVEPGNDIRHSEGLTGTCNTKQSLKLVAFLEAPDQFFDCLRLVTGGFVFGV